MLCLPCPVQSPDGNPESWNNLVLHSSSFHSREVSDFKTDSVTHFKMQGNISPALQKQVLTTIYKYTVTSLSYLLGCFFLDSYINCWILSCASLQVSSYVWNGTPLISWLLENSQAHKHFFPWHPLSDLLWASYAIWWCWSSYCPSHSMPIVWKSCIWLRWLHCRLSLEARGNESLGEMASYWFSVSVHWFYGNIPWDLWIRQLLSVKG